MCIDTSWGRGASAGTGDGSNEEVMAAATRAQVDDEARAPAESSSSLPETASIPVGDRRRVSWLNQDAGVTVFHLL